MNPLRVTLFCIVLSIITIVLMAMQGCLLERITTIPEVGDKPEIGRDAIQAIFTEFDIDKEAIPTDLEMSKYQYSIATIDEVMEIQSDVWSVIAQSPFDARDRNCVAYANALYVALTWSLPSPPVAVIFYKETCGFPDCFPPGTTGHALIMMVTVEHNLMFIEPRRRWDIYPFDRDVTITEIRM